MNRIKVICAAAVIAALSGPCPCQTREAAAGEGSPTNVIIAAGPNNKNARPLAKVLELLKESFAIAWRKGIADPAQWLAAGDRALAHRNYSCAISCFGVATMMFPENPDAKKGLAIALVAAGRHAEAVPVYQSILKLSPGDRTTLFNLSVAQSRLGCVEDSRQTLLKLVAEHPDFVEARYNLATLCQSQGRLAEARDEWKEVTRLAPHLAHPYAALGEVLMDLGDNAGAADAFATFAHKSPNDFAAQYNAAITAARADRLGQAAAACNAALKLNPQSSAANKLLAEILYAAWRASFDPQVLEDAIAAAGQAVHLDNEDPDAQGLLERLCRLRKHDARR